MNTAMKSILMGVTVTTISMVIVQAFILPRIEKAQDRATPAS